MCLHSSEMVKVLVAHGASIDLRGGSDSWTPLMYAAMAGMLLICINRAD